MTEVEILWIIVMREPFSAFPVNSDNLFSTRLDHSSNGCLQQTLFKNETKQNGCLTQDPVCFASATRWRTPVQTSTDKRRANATKTREVARKTVPDISNRYLHKPISRRLTADVVCCR